MGGAGTVCERSVQTSPRRLPRRMAAGEPTRRTTAPSALVETVERTTTYPRRFSWSVPSRTSSVSSVNTRSPAACSGDSPGFFGRGAFGNGSADWKPGPSRVTSKMRSPASVQTSARRMPWIFAPAVRRSRTALILARSSGCSTRVRNSGRRSSSRRSSRFCRRLRSSISAICEVTVCARSPPARTRLISTWR
jgi:hypothetical protein